MEFSFEAVFNTFNDSNDPSNDPPPEKPIKSKTKPKKKFSPDEDKIIIEQVGIHGEKGWRHIAEHVPGRTARQCRERWVNYLSPNVSHTSWTQEEDNLLAQLVATNGQQWSKIAANFKSRTDVMLKNRWAYLKRRITLPLKAETEKQDDQETMRPVAPSTEPIIEVKDESEVSHNFQLDQAESIWQANEEFIYDNIGFCEQFQWME